MLNIAHLLEKIGIIQLITIYLLCELKYFIQLLSIIIHTITQPSIIAIL